MKNSFAPALALAVAIAIPGTGVVGLRVAEGQEVGETSTPLNPQWLDYQDRLATGRVEYTTPDGAGLGWIPPIVELPCAMNPQPSRQPTAFASRYDLRDIPDKLPPVRDQGSCASAWIFAAYGSLESCLRPTEKNWDFSEMHMNCFHGFNAGDCNGGNWRMVTAYLARWDGPADESCCPYTPPNCPAKPTCGIQKRIQNVLFLPTRTGSLDNNAIKNAITNHGAVATSMYWNNDYYNPPPKAYYYALLGTTPNHAVCIVGWDDDFDKNKFSNPPPGNGAFIVRDSRGTAFGENGYFYVSYYDANIGMDNAVFTGAESTSVYTRVYQYDTYGWVSQLPLMSGDSTWFASIFTAVENEQLAAVSFYTPAVNAGYLLRVYLYPAPNDPSNGILTSEQSGTIAEVGYHTIQLQTPVSIAAERRFSVVVRLNTPNYNAPLVFEWPLDGYSNNATAELGQSFRRYDDGTWSDFSTIRTGGNVCLKAFTATPLPIPANVRASNDLADRVEVEWDAVAEATGYKVFRHTENSPGYAQEIGSCAASPYADTTAGQGIDYYYWVKATNGPLESSLSSHAIGSRVPGPQIITDKDAVIVPEGGTATFQVKLPVEPATDTTITVALFSGDDNISILSGTSLNFTTANWDVYQAVTLAAAEDPDATNGTAIIRCSEPNSTAKDVIVTEADNDTLEIVTDKGTLSVPEGGTATFQVRLSAQPATATVVSVVRISGDSNITIASGSSLTFNAANWNVYQTVTLAAGEDGDASNGTATIQCSAAGLPNRNVTATEQDNDTLAITTDRTSVTIAEGSTATFQVRLTAQPLANITVSVTRNAGDTDISVSSGANLTFTPSDWNTYQTVTLTANEDADLINGQATIRCSATGLPDKDVTAIEQDNDFPIIVTDKTDVTVPENSTAVFQVKLGAQPPSDLTVTVGRFSGDNDITVQSGTTLNFTTANWDVYQTVTLAAAEDPDATNGTAIIRCSEPNSTAKDVTATEADNDTLEILTDKSAVSVPEGGTATFQVKLSAQPATATVVSVVRTGGDSNITIASGSSLTFNAANWSVYQTVTLAAAEDADASNGTATIQCSATGLPNRNLTATEQDNDTLAITTDKTSVIVAEGSSATFQVRLTAQPLANTIVSVIRTGGDNDISVASGANLTFTAANWNTYQTVTLQAQEDPDVCPGQAAIRCSAAGLSDKTVTATEQDNDTLDIVTSASAVTVPESGTATFQVKLSRPPCEDLTVSIARISGDGDLSVSSDTSLLFTTSNWDSYQTVTLAAAEDEDAANGQATIRCQAVGINPANLTANEQDNDLPLLVLDRDTVTVPQGGTATFQVKLERQPDANVVVQVERINGDNDITVKTGQTLTFTPVDWDNYQVVTLAAAADLDMTNGQATIRCLAPGLPSRDVVATELDPDMLAMITNVAAVAVPEGGTAGFQVKLNVRPESDVVVNVSAIGGDDDIIVSSGTNLTFTTTDWNVYQNVTLAAAEDDDTANGQTTIRCSAAGLPDKDIIATELDNDTLDIVTDKTAVVIAEGGTASFQVKLSAPPGADVIIGVGWAGGDDSIIVKSGPTMVFTTSTWNTYQTVLLAASADPDQENGQATIRCSSIGLTYKDVIVTEQDNTSPAPPDADGDGIPDSGDNCPDMANQDQADTDGDRVGNACDACPNDKLKTAPGECGCGIPETDRDGDGAKDCKDGCPDDANKTQPGICGCGLSDTDLDEDGLPDCRDLCPEDPSKSSPGICGCGKPDIDSDGDGALDCLDGCPLDATRTQPSVCGCGVREFDVDIDGVLDCVDNCPRVHNPDQADGDGDGIGDACQNPSNDAGRATPTDQTTPPATLCGFGAVQALALCTCGLLLMHIASRRRRR